MNFESHLENLKEMDPEIYGSVLKEIERQETTLEMIPSECATYPATMEALGSVFTNKYSEGYPGKRYYGGNQFVDEVETLAIERGKKIFGVPHANVQPYSGSPANLAVYVAVTEPGDTIMGHALPDGGHLTHGWKASATSMFWNAEQYHVKEDGRIDLEEVERLVMEHKPKLIWVGATAYVREFPFKDIFEIAEKVGAYVAADISHISGLVVAGVHASPVEYAHVVTTTTHKTLRGPRGGMILVTQKGLDKDPELAKKIDKAIFPALQGGPHNHQTAGIAVALGQASTPEFKVLNEQIVKNAKALGEAMMTNGINLVSGGTDNHMVLMDCGKGKGVFVQDALDEAGITLNKNTIPKDPSSPFYPSGCRLGTPILSTRGMKEPEMVKVAKWIAEVMEEVKDYSIPDTKEERREYIAKFKKDIEGNETFKKIRAEVAELCKEFPLYK